MRAAKQQNKTLVIRDFTFIDNVVQINQLAAITTNPEAVNSVYNVAFGENINLKELFNLLRELLSKFDDKIGDATPFYGPDRKGDIKHSLASIDKARKLLGYNPKYSVKEGLKIAVDWYYKNL